MDPPEKQCCCCCTVRIGSRIIGYLSLVSSIVNTILLGTTMSSSFSTRSYRAEFYYEQMIPVSIFIYLIANIILSILLLVGIEKRKSSYVFPWLATAFGGIVTVFCTALGSSIVTAIEADAGAFLLVLVISFGCAAVGAYFLRVVYRHYKELLDEEYKHAIRPLSGAVLAMPAYYSP